MTVGEFKKWLEENKVPEDAKLTAYLYVATSDFIEEFNFENTKFYELDEDGKPRVEFWINAYV